MNVLVACEESQAVCTEFRKLGHNAFSCDIVPCSGGHTEWHIMQDVLPLLNGHCMFVTMNNELHVIEEWDLIIAFPPCTHLTITGAAWFEEKRKDGRQQMAIDFFMRFVNCNCEHIAIENPVGIMSTVYAKPTQIIEPWWFGDNVCKKTCLWLKGLPALKQEQTDKPQIEYFTWIDKKTGKVKRQTKWYYETSCLPLKLRAVARSKTFPGIARAMAVQWSKYLANIPSS